MQELVIKCDICLEQLTPEEISITQEHNLRGKLDNGLVSIKDICLKCSKELFDVIKIFGEMKRNN